MVHQTHIGRAYNTPDRPDRVHETRENPHENPAGAAPSAVARRRSGWGSALSAVSALALSLRSAAPRRRNLPATASCVCDTTRDALQPRPHRCINWRPHVAKTQTPRPQARMVHYPRLVPASTAPRAWSFEAHVTRQGGGRLRDQRRPSPSRPHRRPRVQH